MTEATTTPEPAGRDPPPNNDTADDVDDEDEDGSWIPLTPTATTEESFTDDAVPPPYTSGRASQSHRREEMPSSAPNSRPAPPNSRSSARSDRNTTQQQQQQHQQQRRLESRIHLKSNLVDHPIDVFWKRYLWHLALEVWALEWHIRLGLGMVVSGIATKLFLLSTWYFWYPRLVLMTVLMIAATIYLDIFGLQQQLDTMGKMLSSPETVLQIIQQLDATGIRRLAVVVLLIPTALEMRTLSFLSGIKAETGWSLYNMCWSCSLLGLMLYWFRVQHVKPRECLYRGLLVLYGSALWVTIYTTNLSRLPILAAPFLTATGTILITYQDDDMEWISRILRHALRLALRDVLSSMGEKVSEDEMLQLAILRWIADYWASSSSSAPSSSSSEQPSSSSSEERPPSAAAPPPSSGAGVTSNTTSNSGRTANSEASGSSMPQRTNSGSSNTPRRQTQRPSASAILQRRHEVSWEELLPMLNIATEHMTSEVRMLQSDPPPAATGDRPPTSTNSGGTPHRPSSTSTPPPPTPSTNPIDSFHDMLRSLNMDERAEPAVRAYKQAVESFPPTQQTAVLLSVLRRCPAFLTILFHILMAKPGILSSTMVLLPFVVLEYYRIVAWMHCCEQVKVFFETVDDATPEPSVAAEPGNDHNTAARQFIPSALRDADPMVILLMGDTYNPLRPPALLLVWQNVVNSVSALEVGLTAARCAETTAVAVKFAGNVLSLVQLGQEIHQHGILHGLLVMGKEAILLHTLDETIRNRESTKYTHAAMNALENAQRVARNVQTLAGDDKIGHVIQPVMWAACSLSGYGWLWGPREPTTPPHRNEEEDATANNGATNSPTPQEPATEDSKASGDDAPADQKSSGSTAPSTKEEPSAATTPKKKLTELSDLMEAIVESYGNGEIDQAQKDELCERLSRVSSTDTSAVKDIQKTLAEFAKKSTVQPAPPAEDEKERVRSSAVMEMVLAAYYRGLISPTEKIAFCQRIASLNDEERTDPEVVGGMIRTLTGILEHGEPIEESTTSTEDLSHPEGNSNNADEPRPEPETSSSHISSASAAPVVAAEARSQPEHVDGEFYNDNPQPSSSSTNISGTRSDQGTQPQEAERNQHDGLIRLGMATLSFVVGGVLLSQNGGNNEQQQQQQERRGRQNQEESSTSDRNETAGNGRSTVRIVEIEDEGEEEWVNVPQ